MSRRKSGPSLTQLAIVVVLGLTTQLWVPTYVAVCGAIGQWYGKQVSVALFQPTSAPSAPKR